MRAPISFRSSRERCARRRRRQDFPSENAFKSFVDNEFQVQEKNKYEREQDEANVTCYQWEQIRRNDSLDAYINFQWKANIEAREEEKKDLSQ